MQKLVKYYMEYINKIGILGPSPNPYFARGKKGPSPNPEDRPQIPIWNYITKSFRLRLRNLHQRILLQKSHQNQN